MARRGRGGYRLPWAWSRAALVGTCAALAAAGCGGNEGVAEGAEVTAYAVAPLCSEAREALRREGGGAGGVRVRVVCLEEAEGEEGALATIGAGARHATEDSTAIVYMAEPDPLVVRFARPILDSAGILLLVSKSGTSAMSDVLRAVREADGGSLREAVRDNLSGAAS